MNRRLLTPGNYIHGADAIQFNTPSFTVNSVPVSTLDPVNAVISASSSVSINSPTINLNATTPKITGIFGGAPSAPQMVVVNASGALGSQAIPSGPDGGITSFGPVGAAPNANGAIVSGTNIGILQPADATRPGVLTAIAQPIGGAKTFAAAPILSTGVFGVTPSSAQMMTINSSGILGSQAIPSGGVTTMTAVGVTPNANAAVISGSNLTLEPASVNQPGVVNTSAGGQTFGGFKIFNDGIGLGPAFTGNAINTFNGGLLLWDGNFGDDTSIFMGNGSGTHTTQANGNNFGAGINALNKVTSGDQNVGIGAAGVLSRLLTGRGNLAFGGLSGIGGAGSNYAAAENHNIVFHHPGVLGESGVIRLGYTNQTTCFIAGITGVTSVGAVPAVINGSGQLGTVVSSKRKKNTITAVTEEKLDALMELEPVSFYMNDDVNKEFLNYGLIAEQVETKIPEVIRYEPDDKSLPQTIDYPSLWALSLAQTQRVTKELKELKRWRTDLEDANPALFKIQRIV